MKLQVREISQGAQILNYQERNSTTFNHYEIYRVEKSKNVTWRERNQQVFIGKELSYDRFLEAIVFLVIYWCKCSPFSQL